MYTVTVIERYVISEDMFCRKRINFSQKIFKNFTVLYTDNTEFFFDNLNKLANKLDEIQRQNINITNFIFCLVLHTQFE